MNRRSHLLVTTTNNDLQALRFYRRYWSSSAELRIRAVDEARLRKPSIPFVGFGGIAMHDEIDLSLSL